MTQRTVHIQTNYGSDIAICGASREDRSNLLTTLDHFIHSSPPIGWSDRTPNDADKCGVCNELR